MLRQHGPITVKFEQWLETERRAIFQAIWAPLSSENSAGPSCLQSGISRFFVQPIGVGNHTYIDEPTYQTPTWANYFGDEQCSIVISCD